MSDGWEDSADAWIASMGAAGDFSRKHVLDTPMLARVHRLAPQSVLDLGCGEGRFCRMLAPTVPQVTGIDPTKPLIEWARTLSDATYHVAKAEDLPFEGASFDLVISYLTLIDIPDIPSTIAEVARVLRPGGRFLIANLSSWATSSHNVHGGWKKHDDGSTSMTMDHYMVCRASWAEWDGIRILNWHRPQAFYMQALLSEGFRLTHFEEPQATGGARAETYNRAPYLHMMEWQKPCPP